jgi:hypothetical protein
LFEQLKSMITDESQKDIKVDEVSGSLKCDVCLELDLDPSEEDANGDEFEQD